MCSSTLPGVGNAGSPYAPLQRSLRTGNPQLALAAAVEMPGPLKLADALALVLVLARAGDPRWERAAVRWAARYSPEARPSPDGAEARQVLAAVSALVSTTAPAAVETLHALADARGLERVCRALDEYGPAAA